jgi:hydroxyacylglutathione hydrolase
MNIKHFTFGPFQENTYIISDENQHCWIIDPGMSHASEEKELKAYIQNHKLIPQAIYNTHAHIDHILGVDYCVEQFQIPFYLYCNEAPILNNASNTAKMFGFDYNGVQASVNWISEETKEINWSDAIIQILHVPGHSPGSIAFYNPTENWVISGDALFQMSIGRTDLLMGNHDQLIESIKNKLLPLPESTKVYSGHGPITTIGFEKTNNPFLK